MHTQREGDERRGRGKGRGMGTRRKERGREERRRGAEERRREDRVFIASLAYNNREQRGQEMEVQPRPVAGNDEAQAAKQIPYLRQSPSCPPVCQHTHREWPP